MINMNPKYKTTLNSDQRMLINDGDCQVRHKFQPHAMCKK